jgi:hypothetical protein
MQGKCFNAPRQVTVTVKDALHPADPAPGRGAQPRACEAESLIWSLEYSSLFHSLRLPCNIAALATDLAVCTFNYST